MAGPCRTGRAEIKDFGPLPPIGAARMATTTGAGVCTRCSDDLDGGVRGAGVGKTGVAQQSSCAHEQQAQTRTCAASLAGKANEPRAMTSPNRMLQTAFTVLLSF